MSPEPFPESFPEPGRAAAYTMTLTPFGPFTTLVDASGAVLASGWTEDVGGLLPLVHRELRPEELRLHAEIAGVTDAVVAFHDREPGPAAAVPVRQRGGPFVAVVWERMREIRAGAPVTFAELAERSGRPGSIRGAATACSRNVATLFVPCHRVLRGDGGVAGFRWGVTLKERLLEMEAAATWAEPP